MTLHVESTGSWMCRVIVYKRSGSRFDLAAMIAEVMDHCKIEPIGFGYSTGSMVVGYKPVNTTGLADRSMCNYNS